MRGATISDVLRHARIAVHALIEAVMVEAVAPRHVGGVTARGTIERGALVQRRKMMGAAEGVEVEGVWG